MTDQAGLRRVSHRDDLVLEVLWEERLDAAGHLEHMCDASRFKSVHVGRSFQIAKIEPVNYLVHFIYLGRASQQSYNYIC